MAPLGTSLNREATSIADINFGLEDIHKKLLSRLDKKGWGAYASRHEILGIITEEFLELTEAIRSDTPEGYDHYMKECMDMAVAGLFGYICMKYYIKP